MLGAAIPITMVTAAQLQTDLDAFITQEAEFNAAQSARLAASETYQGTTAPAGVIAGVLPGQTVELVVQAVNGTKQGVASAPVIFTMPLAAKAATPAKRAKAEEPVAAGEHENGNGHGALRHSRVA